ncbi:MAG: hypothetical protein HC857_16305, partial [Synechococcales cyanobacterium RU_4_20]|nr:hypothetical protein [Synechococcales cyanobacterium RU_4_20]
MLDQALTGLIDRFTRQLPAQSHLNLQVSLAGHQLKLQFKARDRDGKPITATIDDGGGCPGKSRSKSLGQLLSFQPATGSLSLNLAMTKNIFQALGGKLLIKERPQQGEVVTVFFAPPERSRSMKHLHLKILLMRHGETWDNQAQRMQGQRDRDPAALALACRATELSGSGQQQVLALGGRLGQRLQNGSSAPPDLCQSLR